MVRRKQVVTTPPRDILDLDDSLRDDGDARQTNTPTNDKKGCGRTSPLPLDIQNRVESAVCDLFGAVRDDDDVLEYYTAG